MTTQAEEISRSDAMIKTFQTGSMPFLRTDFQDTGGPSHALDIKVVPGNTYKLRPGGKK